jgi:uncharacterized protein (UPF0276 family)
VIALCITHIDGLEQLIGDPRLSFQYLRVGSWYDRARLRDVVDQYLGRPFLYHYNHNLPAAPAKTATIIETLRSAAGITATPWLSAHLDQHSDDEITGLLRHGRRPPPYSTSAAFERICGAVRRIQPHLPVPLLLENVPHWPLPEPDVGVTPEFIRDVLDETGCDFLLDTAHAVVSAHAFGIDPRAYIAALPLERLVEVHVSGPRMREGRMVDSHEPLDDDDLDLLTWVLARTTPHVVTLEYARDVAEFPDQIARLKRVLDVAPAP